MPETASLPDFNKLWDYNDPAATEEKFRALLPNAETSGDAGYHLELLTQIARTHSLRRQFDEAHAILDAVEERLTPDMPRARIRYLLERGRAFNSAKEPERARPLFLEALELGQEAGEDNYAIDAAHMLAIVDPPAQQIEWSEKALEMTERTQDETAKRWLGPLYNNLGWTYHDIGSYDRALDLFEKGVAFRATQPPVGPLRIAKWAVARCKRSLGRVEEALAEQLALQTEHEQDGSEDGYVQEELGECLYLLGRTETARPHFARAYELLSKDEWLAENEPERIARLNSLAAGA